MGQSVPPPNSEKFAKNQEKKKKLGKRKNWGRKGKNWEGSFTLPFLTDRAGYATAHKREEGEGETNGDIFYKSTSQKWSLFWGLVR